MNHQGAGGLQPPEGPDSDKAIIFQAKAYFSGKRQQPKMKKKFFLHLLNEKTEFILYNEIKYPKSRIFTNNYWVG